MLSTSEDTLAKARRRAVITSILGNSLEFYDTTIYAFFAVYFAGHFFPSNDALVSQISAFAVFGLSYFVRPFGGIIVSIYADKIGRKPMIVGLMFAMAFSTGCIGFLPTYAQVGIAAPILLIIVRLIQAVAVGGVFSSTTAFLMEFAPPNKRGFYASMQMIAQALAPVLSNLVALALLYSVGKSALADSWWRVAFLLGFLTAPLGYYIHKFVDETPEFKEHMERAQIKTAQAKAIQLTLGQTLRQPIYVKKIICCLGLIMVGTVSFFGNSIYMPGYIQNVLNLADSERTWLALLVPTFATFGVLISGHLCDRISRIRVMQAGIICYALAFFAFFFYLSTSGANYSGALLGASLIGFCMGLHWGVLPVLLSESYPIQIRATAMSIAYNGAVVLFGAMTPTYLGILEKIFGKSPANPLFYIGLSIVVGFVASHFWRPDESVQAAKTP